MLVGAAYDPLAKGDELSRPIVSGIIKDESHQAFDKNTVEFTLQASGMRTAHQTSDKAQRDVNRLSVGSKGKGPARRGARLRRRTHREPGMRCRK